ncbi:hypothetical protein Avbf_16258 [Armadillidium vulgare]|nr:hypothetical protein Avbf_16258 [Armadillidium vulgare]
MYNQGSGRQGNVTNRENVNKIVKCFRCGKTGHMISECRWANGYWSGKRVRRGVTDGKPSDVNGAQIVKEVSVDVFSIGQVNECMSVKVYCGGIEVRVFIDTGCMVSVVYKKAYDRMKIKEDQKESEHGNIKGISNMFIPVEIKFRESVRIGGIGMEESEFYVIKGDKEKYDVLLGYKFLSANGMVIHPDRMMIEKKINKEGKCQIYVNELGDVKVKLLKGVEVYALEDVSLKTDEVVSVKVGWNANVGVDVDDQNCMFLFDGYDAKYRVKRVAYVFDGILDMNNPRSS